MNRFNLLRVAFGVAVVAFALSQPLAKHSSDAAPGVYAFLGPPMLPLQGARSPLHALPYANAAACTPSGSIAYSGNDVSVALNLVRANFTINNPDPTDPYGGQDPVTLRSYGGCKTGPEIDVAPGSTIHVRLNNQLPANDPSCSATPPPGLGLVPGGGPGCFNTTNLHTHGLHVSPSGNSDNVLLAIAPQTSFSYDINIPSNHPSGTFWYHAHMHGSTAVQVGSGAAGILIVRGNRPYRAPTAANPNPIADIDTILHNAAGVNFPETTFLFQQIAYGCFANDPANPQNDYSQLYTTAGLYSGGGGPPPPPPATPNPAAVAPWVCPTPSATTPVSRGVVENFGLQLGAATIWDTSGRFTSINGIVQPTITVPAGRILRWRMIHAGIHDTVNVQIVRAPGSLSSFRGNRKQQKAEVAAACASTTATRVPQFEYAQDGLTRTHVKVIDFGANAAGTTTPLQSNYMQPGYRSDILVVFPRDGDYCMLNQSAPAPERAENGGGGQGPSIPQLLAYVRVRGGVAVSGGLSAYVGNQLYNANPQLPAAVRQGLRNGNLTPWAPFVNLAPPAAGTPIQVAQMAIGFSPATGVAFSINGNTYNPNVVNYTRQVNTTDDWALSALGEPHIFHIHVNPFEIMDVVQVVNGARQSIYNADGTCKPFVYTDTAQLADEYCGMWHTFRDTVFVEQGYEVDARTYYDTFIGEFVLHCHILDHEDSGMMQNVNIVPNLSSPGGGLGMPRMHMQMQPRKVPAASPQQGSAATMH